MSGEAYTEVIRRVFDGSEGASILVQPYDEEFIEVKTNPDKVSIEWFGDHKINFSPKVARAVAHAILKLADEMEQP